MRRAIGTALALCLGRSACGGSSSTGTTSAPSTKGGDLVNIVPAEVCLETYVRGRTSQAILDASHKVDRAVRGAALALGCRVEIETVPGNLPLRNDPPW